MGWESGGKKERIKRKRKGEMEMANEVGTEESSKMRQMEKQNHGRISRGPANRK